MRQKISAIKKELKSKRDKLSDLEKVFCENLVASARNSKIEDIHSGTPPLSKTGDYSDVKVVTPFGEIPWNKVSKISQKEMGELKDSIRESIQNFIVKAKEEYGIEIKFDENSMWTKMVKEHILPNKNKFYVFKK